MQTQCPQCHTAFRVSEEQLQIANGQVRCGQCLHVFIASQHLISEAQTPLKAEDEFSVAEIALETREFEPLEELSTHELFTSDIELEELEVAEIEMPILEAHALRDITVHTDAAADEQIEDASETPAPIELSDAPEEDSTSETPLGPSLATSQSPCHLAVGIAAANEEWPISCGGETESPVADDEGEEKRVADLTAEQAITETANKQVEQSAIPLLVDGFDASQLYPELEAPALPERPQHTGLYSLAILGLLAIFLLQGTYALRDSLAAEPALRPLMSEFCATFNCALSLPREPDKILLSRSEIRSHPARSHALLVKASLQNQARFRQAYPILRLQFSDLEGQPMLGRDFMPEEYLPDDVNIEAGMPINSSVNLSLELVDPGSQAVSFDFRLL